MSHQLDWFDIQVNVEVAQLILGDGTLIREHGAKLINRPRILSLLDHSEPQHTSGGHVPETMALCCPSTGEPFRGDGPVSTEVAAGESGVGHAVSLSIT